MTDGGSAYPEAASKSQMVRDSFFSFSNSDFWLLLQIHVLCAHHFQQDVFSSCGGMQAMATSFKQHAIALIYSPFTEHEFSEHMNMFFEKYIDFPSAKGLP